MLAAINLDDNFCLMTGEVREVRTDRRLPPEMIPLSALIGPLRSVMFKRNL